MKKVLSYMVSWNTKNDEGTFILHTSEGTEQLLADSASEGLMMLQLLNDKNGAHVQDGILFTGFQVEEEAPTPKKKELSAKNKSKKKSKKKSGKKKSKTKNNDD